MSSRYHWILLVFTALGAIAAVVSGAAAVLLLLLALGVI